MKTFKIYSLVFGNITITVKKFGTEIRQLEFDNKERLLNYYNNCDLTTRQLLRSEIGHFILDSLME